MTFKDLSLEEIIAKIKSGETTQSEVNTYFLERIKKYDSSKAIWRNAGSCRRGIIFNFR